MVAEQLYQRLIRKGLLLTSEDGERITVSPARLLSHTDREQIRQNKADLLVILASRQPGSSGQNGDIARLKRTRAKGELCRFRLGDEEVAVHRYRPGQGRVYDNRFALDCETELVQGHRIPRLALVSVSDGKAHYLIHPDDLGAFVRAHADLHVVFHNAAFDFWVVHGHLVRHRHPKAAAAWMDLLRRRRLHDTMLLDMLVRLADGSDNRPDVLPRDLGEVAGQYTGIKLDKGSPYRVRFGELIGADWSGVDPEFFAYALPDAIATARAHPALRRRALDLMKAYGFDQNAEDTFNIDPAAVRKFGVLTESVQVGAAIALAQIERTGMHTDQNRLAQTAESYRRTVDALIGKLNRRYPGLFKLNAAGELKRTQKTGVPSKSTKTLDGYLLRAVKEIKAKTGEVIEVPRTAKGQVAKALDAWAALVDQHPFLRLWADYEKATKLCQFLGSLSEPIVRPHYRTFCRTGRTTCSSPNVQQVPRRDDFREVVVPSPKHLLLAVDYKFIELVTLAAACQCRFGVSKLAEVIRAGVDPHCYTAAMLLGMTYKKFMQLKAAATEKFKRWRQASKGINFGVPGGLGAMALVDYVRGTYEVELSLEEAQQFRQRLIEEVYPELKLFLADTGLEALADNLGVALEDVQAAFGTAGGNISHAAGSVRKIVEGRPFKQDGTPYSEPYVERVWDSLNDLNRQPELARLLSLRVGSPELAKRLFRASVATLSGRIRDGVSYTAERNTQFQGLAADGAKIALANLVVKSFRVVGFVHDEILVELPDEGSGRVRWGIVEEVVKIVRASMEEVTYGVPVGCEYTVSTCWSKRAKLIERGDWIYAWRPN